MSSKSFFLILFLQLLSGNVKNVAAQTTGSLLQSKIDNIASSDFYKHASLGVSVRDAKTGEVVGQVQKDKMLVPASSLKLITTLSGREILGPEFRYETKISHDGFIDTDGTLKGNLYIEGSGDPTLGSDRIKGNLNGDQLFRKIISDVKTHGITCVEGDIIADESVFNSFPISPSWQWNDLGNYYAAGAWGLNVHENEYAIYFHRNGPIGSLSRIAYFKPFVPNLELDNEVTIDDADSGDNAYIFGGPYHYGKRVVGTIPRGKNLFVVKGSLPDPPSYFSYRVLQELEKNDMGGHIYKTQYRPDTKKSSRKKITSYFSSSLNEIIKLANDRSINIYCESILKTIGIRKRNAGSGGEGIAAIEDLLQSRNMDIRALHMEDGSGLSTRNLVSPDFLTNFLCNYVRDKNLNDITPLLPRVGVEGTVKFILINSPAKGNMWIKSGSMDKILTYSGYCKAASGRYVAFSVFLNASTAKKKSENKAELEKILDAIYRFS